LYKPRIALVVSHPIQHFCPQYVSFAKHPEIIFKVFFGSALGFKKYVDPGFQREISWTNLQLEKFDHVFLQGEQLLAADKNLDAPALNDAMDQFAPDIVIGYGYFQPLQRRAKAWVKKNKKKLAYIADTERKQHRPRWKEWIQYPLLWNYFRDINYFLTVGDANEDYFRFHRVGPEKFIRMHFPIDTCIYKKAFSNRQSLREEIRRQYGIKKEMPVLAVVGKLVPWKNQDHIIEAMELLEQQNIITELFILGTGHDLRVLQQKAIRLKTARVHFPGFVQPEDLPAFYAASDIYVHPASVEPHSLAISEAIYMGCPVIVSDRCGSYGKTDDVQQERNGYVYEFGEIKELAAKISRMIGLAGIRADFGQYSHYIAEGFQQRSHSGSIDELLKRFRYDQSN